MGYGSVRRFGAATAAVFGLLGGLVPLRAAAADQPPPCLPSGTGADIQAGLVGPGAQVRLCPGSVFELRAPVVATADGQSITTAGDPTGGDRARLVVDDPDLSVALQFTGRSHVSITSIEVDGERRRYGYAPTAADGGTGDALVQGGGASTGQLVRGVVIRDARSWSALHISEGPTATACRDAAVLDDVVVGPRVAAGFQWSDGISFACSHSRVSGNVVTDASDGGIVVFSAPGNLVDHNTVRSIHQEELGGINLVDHIPEGGDDTGTVVRDNVVAAVGAPMHIGIAQGWGAWFCATAPHQYDQNVLRGASVLDNHVGGAQMIYGMVVSGVRDWTVAGNVVEPNRIAQPATTGCESKAADPAPLLIQAARSRGSFQPGFVNAHVHGALFAVTSWGKPVRTTPPAPEATATTTPAASTAPAPVSDVAAAGDAPAAVPVAGTAAFTG